MSRSPSKAKSISAAELTSLAQSAIAKLSAHGGIDGGGKEAENIHISGRFFNTLSEAEAFQKAMAAEVKDSSPHVSSVVAALNGRHIAGFVAVPEKSVS